MINYDKMTQHGRLYQQSIMPDEDFELEVALVENSKNKWLGKVDIDPTLYTLFVRREEQNGYTLRLENIHDLIGKPGKLRRSMRMLGREQGRRKQMVLGIFTMTSAWMLQSTSDVHRQPEKYPSLGDHPNRKEIAVSQGSTAFGAQTFSAWEIEREPDPRYKEGIIKSYKPFPRPPGSQGKSYVLDAFWEGYHKAMHNHFKAMPEETIEETMQRLAKELNVPLP